MTEDPATVLLDVLRDLCHELGRVGSISLDARFQEDLGIDSLGRMELLLRLKKRLGVEIPDDAAFGAETPRELLASFTGGAPLAPPTRRALAGGAVAIPADATTLNEVLRYFAERTPTRVHLTVLDGDAARDITYGELEHAARRVAGALRAAGIEVGDRVALMLPTCPEYFPCFLGVLLAGAIPVPIYPPASWRLLGEHMERQRHVLTDAGAVALITARAAEAVSAMLPPIVPALRLVLLADDALAGVATDPVTVAPEDLALLQYTSGSTSAPKGVALSHRNILANIRAIGVAQRLTPDDVCVSWLPLYHDMGLIGAWLGSLYHGCRLVVMSPLAFLAAPQRWLHAIHRHGGTISTAPNFAYEICATRLPEDSLTGLDLSRWRVALNGAETVSSGTIERFNARFGPAGFPPHALSPVYGLAESCVALTMPPVGTPARVDVIDRRALQDLGEARAVPPASPAALRVVGCGQPIEGHELRIVLPGGGLAPDRREGRIQFRGPSATRGYFNRPEVTLFDGTWLETGDLGYIAGGHLYVTGRIKDLIVRAGRNVHPQAIEEAAGDVDGVRKGCVAVFASVAGAGASLERLVVVAETRRTEGLDLLQEEVRRRVAVSTGEQVDEVILVPPQTIPKTSSGKIQRAACRQRYESGVLQPGRPRWRQLLPLAQRAVSVAARRAWRGAKEWAYCAWFFLATVTMQPLGLVAVVLTPGVARRRRVVGGLMRFFLRITGTRVTVRGAEHLAGHCLLVVNHQGLLDTILMPAILDERFFFTPKRDIATSPVAAKFMSALGHQLVDRLDPRTGVADLEPVKRRLRGGECAVVYPEGIFYSEPGLRHFYLGAFTVAAETGTPVVPVAISGARRIWPGTRFPFFRHGSVEITILPPMRASGSDWSAAVRLMRASRAAILSHCGEFDAGDLAPSQGARAATVAERAR